MKAAASKIRVPLIVSDIDGVALLRQHAMPRVKEALQALTRPLHEISPKQFPNVTHQIPVCFMTNRSAITEASLTHAFNTAYGANLIREQQMITCCTPLRDIYARFDKKVILVVARTSSPALRARVDEYLRAQGVTHYVTNEEYCNLYPKLVPLSSQTRDAKKLQAETLEAVAGRLGLTHEQVLADHLQVHGIFIVMRPTQWEENLQLILDLLSTEDGRIAKKMPEKGPATHIPVYATFNDLMHKDEFQLPRMLMKPFTESLKLLHRQLYKTDLRIDIFGKPEVTQFRYTQLHAQQYLVPQSGDVEISNVYMIGDNVETDIFGANNAGWTSILVKTGVFQGDACDKAKFLVNDFNDAVKLILELEGIDNQIPF